MNHFIKNFAVLVAFTGLSGPAYGLTQQDITGESVSSQELSRETLFDADDLMVELDKLGVLDADTEEEAEQNLTDLFGMSLLGASSFLSQENEVAIASRNAKGNQSQAKRRNSRGSKNDRYRRGNDRRRGGDGYNRGRRGRRGGGYNRPPRRRPPRRRPAPPRYTYYTCYAENLRGQSFRSTGTWPDMVQQQAINYCERHSLLRCYRRGCHRVR